MKRMGIFDDRVGRVVFRIVCLSLVLLLLATRTCEGHRGGHTHSYEAALPTNDNNNNDNRMQRDDPENNNNNQERRLMQQEQQESSPSTITNIANNFNNFNVTDLNSWGKLFQSLLDGFLQGSGAGNGPGPAINDPFSPNAQNGGNNNMNGNNQNGNNRNRNGEPFPTQESPMSTRKSPQQQQIPYNQQQPQPYNFQTNPPPIQNNFFTPAQPPFVPVTQFPPFSQPFGGPDPAQSIVNPPWNVLPRIGGGVNPYDPQNPNRNLGLGEGSLYVNSPTLPPSQAKYFNINGEFLEIKESQRFCDNTRRRTPSKLGERQLVNLAMTALFYNQSLCRQGRSGPPPPGEPGGPPAGVNGGPPRGGFMPDLPIFPANEDPSKCLTKSNVGACSPADNSQLVESIYFQVELGQNHLIVVNGIPNHCYTRGDDGGLACENFKAFLMPKSPRYTQQFKKFGGGGSVIGVTVAGSILSSHAFDFLSGQCDIVLPIQRWTFGPCDGHANPACLYHIHKAPVCMTGFDTCGLMGYMLDGFAIYGKCTIRMPDGRLQRLRSCYRKKPGRNGCDTTHFEYRKGPDCHLDEAGGYFFNQDTISSDGKRFRRGTYGYFFTAEYPFLNPGYFGELQKQCDLDPNDIRYSLNSYYDSLRRTNTNSYNFGKK